MSDEVDGAPKTTGRVYLGVFRVDGSPQEVTDVIGAPATRVWAKGQLSHRARSPETHTRCWFESALPDTAEVEEQLDELLPRLESLAAGIARAKERWRCVLVIYQDSQDYNVQVELTTEHVKRIAVLGLPIWVDAYRLGDDDEPGA